MAGRLLAKTGVGYWEGLGKEGSKNKPGQQDELTMLSCRTGRPPKKNTSIMAKHH